MGNVFQHGKARAGDAERRLYFTEFMQWCSEVQDRPRSYFDSMALQVAHTMLTLVTQQALPRWSANNRYSLLDRLWSRVLIDHGIDRGMYLSL